jgi:hypothetical protein
MYTHVYNIFKSFILFHKYVVLLSVKIYEVLVLKLDKLYEINFNMYGL